MNARGTELATLVAAGFSFVLLYCVNERVTGVMHEVEKTKIVQIGQDSQIEELIGRTKYPKFSKHCDSCRQCRDPQATDDGPESLCERGYELMKEDMRPDGGAE